MRGTTGSNIIHHANMNHKRAGRNRHAAPDPASPSARVALPNGNGAATETATANQPEEEKVRPPPFRRGCEICTCLSFAGG